MLFSLSSISVSTSSVSSLELCILSLPVSISLSSRSRLHTLSRTLCPLLVYRSNAKNFNHLAGKMAEDKEATTSSASQGLTPHQDPDDAPKSPPNSPNFSTRKAWYTVLQSWVSKKFMTGFVVLSHVAVTSLITWWFIQFVDGFFRYMRTLVLTYLVRLKS